MKLRRIAAYLVVLSLLVGGAGLWLSSRPPAPASPGVQTDVDRAQHLLDAKGVPYLKIAQIGEQRHPAWIAIYALAYAGEEVYAPHLVGLADEQKFQACLDWLEANLKRQASGLWVWEYGFDNTYNDLSIKAPWSSAFAQATGIQAFLAGFRRTGDKKYLDLARRAAESLFVSLERGGFLFERGDDVWFEEIPVPAANPGHILNGHMRVLLALNELSTATGDAQIAGWLKRGTDTLYRWLPRYDTGYWLRYDLNPQKRELLFRFAEPYGNRAPALAIDSVTLRDPLTGKSVSLDVGSTGDAEGPQRIAGTHWGQTEQFAGRNVRRLVPAALEKRPDELAAPHSYFYLALPGEWDDNLRNQWYELSVSYFDEAPGNVQIQKRAIAPGEAFRDLRDGELLLTGAGEWRTWVVPVRPSDLGYWVGQSYAEKHAEYLARVAGWDSRFAAWARVAGGYAGRSPGGGLNQSAGQAPQPRLPAQTPMVPVYSFDSTGVVRLHLGDAKTRWNPDGTFDYSGSRGIPVYSPYIVAAQAIHGEAMPGADRFRIDRKRIRRSVALAWLMDPANFRAIGEAAIYTYPFENVYNDVVTVAPWASAFGQAYVLKALVTAANERGARAGELRAASRRAAAAFAVPVNQGGVKAVSRSGSPWFEEVPNATHVLNAHLVSVAELADAARALGDADAQALSAAGIEALRENLHLFDTGYWLRYDQNPRKQILLQLDWRDGTTSPLIDTVELVDPQAGRAATLDVGRAGDADGAVRVSGAEWLAEQIVDGQTVRGFGNGYVARRKPVQGGARHNAFVVFELPGQHVADGFDMPAHRLAIRYKDTAPGTFVLKIQSIHEGAQATFVPLRGGVWATQGDQQWKSVVFELRPQDLGWYKGPDYQRYEVTQLQRIAELTGDWFFRQYAERHRHFLERQAADGGRSALNY